jgi:hypothetical protein
MSVTGHTNPDSILHPPVTGGTEVSLGGGSLRILWGVDQSPCEENVIFTIYT